MRLSRFTMLCCCLTVILTVAQASRAATRVFYDGFENDLSQWTYGYSLGAIVTTAVDSGTPHNGSKMLECNWNGEVEWNDPATYSGAVLNSFDYTSEFLIRMWVRYESDVDHKMGAKLLRLGPYDPDMFIAGGQMEQTNGPLWFHWENINGSSGPQFYGNGTPFGNGTWHKIEIYVKHDTGTANGTLRVWQDGSLMQESVNLITHSAGSKWMPLNLMSNWSSNPGWEHDANNHVCFDEVEIFSDSSNGTAATGSLSDASITVSGGGQPTVTISATDASASEAGSDTGTFTVSRTGSTSSTLAVNYSVSGTASSGDYSPTLSGTVTIASGNSTATITITPADDATVESSETVILTVSSNANYTVGSPSNATVTIADNDGPTVTISATDANAAEQGQDTGTFTVSRTGSTSSALAVNYSVSGTASSGDYTPTLSGTVTIASGSATATITITPADDATAESSETVILTVSSNANYTVGSPSNATVTIADNDSGGGTTVLVNFGSSAANNTYGLAGWSTPFNSANNYYTSDGPAGIVGGSQGAGAYMGVSGSSYTFAVGDQIVVTWYSGDGGQTTFTPKISFDDPDQYNGGTSGTWYNMSQLTLSQGQTGTTTYTIDANSAGTHSLANVARMLDYSYNLICDKIELQTSGGGGQPTVTISATDANASEASSDTGTFTVSRTGSTSSALAVNYAISGTASSGDYTPTLSGTVTIASGSSTAAITITPADDSSYEGSETVILTISSNANYTVGSPSNATVTIADNDKPTVTLTATDAAAAEAAQDPGTFRFSRTGITSSALAVSYAISGTASSGDYTPTLSGTVTIAAGSATTDITITPVDDASAESSETVILTINTNANYTVGSPSSATVTITDNDTLPTVTVSATDANASEAGSDTGTFTITRTGSTSGSLVVNYAMSGTATNGTDYSNLSGSVTINSGSATATVVVTPTNDQTIEGNETAILTISTNANYAVGSPPNATVTIADNDYLLVNFGSSEANNTYGLSGWSTPFYGMYTSYTSVGPAGVIGEYSGSYCTMGVSGSSRTFTTGEVIRVTWYNSGGSSLTFTPKVSFDDTNDMAHSPNGTWYNMSQVTVAAGASATATYTVDAGSAGSHTLVNVCRILDGGSSLVCDKIELVK